MLSRLGIAIFYAIVFFALGAWAGDRVPSLRGMMKQGVDATWDGAQRLKVWAEGTVSSKPAEPADASKTASTPAKGAPRKAEPTQSIGAARDLFAKGNVSEAIAAYQAVLKASPDDADAWGELGNVYYSAGRLPDASRAYFEAATRLLDKGDAARAQALLPAVKANAPALADELERRLRQAAQPTRSL